MCNTLCLDLHFVQVFLQQPFINFPRGFEPALDMKSESLTKSNKMFRTKCQLQNCPGLLLTRAKTVAIGARWHHHSGAGRKDYAPETNMKFTKQTDNAESTHSLHVKWFLSRGRRLWGQFSEGPVDDHRDQQTLFLQNRSICFWQGQQATESHLGGERTLNRGVWEHGQSNHCLGACRVGAYSFVIEEPSMLMYAFGSGHPTTWESSVWGGHRLGVYSLAVYSLSSGCQQSGKIMENHGKSWL